MKLDIALLALSLVTGAAASSVEASHVLRSDVNEHELYKRRGGGGGGGRGGGGGGSRGGSGGGSRGGSGGGGGSSGGGGRIGSGSRSSRPGPSATNGGVSPNGGGTPRSFGNGRYYAGGAPVPYRAGSTIGAGLAGGLLVGSALAFWPGIWLYGAYNYNYYHYHHDENRWNDDDLRPGDLGTYTFFNETLNRNETLPVFCACGEYSVCGCDDDVNEELLDELVGDGDWFDLNHTIINTGRYEGNKVLLINGTLANDTTVAESDVNQSEQDAYLLGEEDDSAAARTLRAMGYWPAAAAVMAAVFLA
ncbi:hypothetical protein B0I35DRAFT_410554 [Stachybotrys elegans]|uniref:DUF7732 domain-containing protein n=1 Tax=Stachybotrys elegans TaxID=80388 RepID=A0A8K0SNQ2_9HYPO|nr:hypothetical protein B0I35DRAFT_410554 [Stachybotrys elegans]